MWPPPLPIFLLLCCGSCFDSCCGFFSSAMISIWRKVNLRALSCGWLQDHLRPPFNFIQSQTLACCLLSAVSRRAARESTTKTSIDQMEPKSNHSIVYPLCPADSDRASFPGKRKTDLERSVSLLTPRYPSDHVQVVVQRPPESSVSTL